MEPNQAPALLAMRPWSITKSEWDGYQRNTMWTRWWLWISIGVQVLFAILVGIAPYLAMRAAGIKLGGSGFLMVAGFFLALAIGQAIWIILLHRRWSRLRPLVWDAQGCVCPWCRVRVDANPCPKHGFTREDQPKLIAYWESLPKFAQSDAVRALDALAATARRRPLSWLVLGPIRRIARASMASQFDANLTPLQRLRASLPWMAVKLVAGIALLVIAYKLLPRQFFTSFVSGCWPFLLMGPLFLLVGPMWRVGRLRCSACAHLCASEQPTICPECGADLTQPAAVVRHEAMPRKWLGFLAFPLLILFLAPFLQDSIVGVLPQPIREAIWTNLRPPRGYWQALTPATMTDAEIDEATQLLIACAAPDGGRPLFDFSFLDSLQKAGKLTPAMLESAARSVVKATLEVEESGGRVSVAVYPAFGEEIMPSKMTPRLVFGGISVDDGAYAQSAGWSLFHDDLDEFWRMNGQLPALPEERLVFRADLGVLPAGEHRIRARCFIVLHEWRWVRYEPQFDERGELIAPAGAQVYELPLETTVTAR